MVVPGFCLCFVTAPKRLVRYCTCSRPNNRFPSFDPFGRRRVSEAHDGAKRGPEFGCKPPGAAGPTDRRHGQPPGLLRGTSASSFHTDGYLSKIKQSASDLPARMWHATEREISSSYPGRKAAGNRFSSVSAFHHFLLTGKGLQSLITPSLRIFHHVVLYRTKKKLDKRYGSKPTTITEFRCNCRLIHNPPSLEAPHNPPHHWGKMQNNCISREVYTVSNQSTGQTTYHHYMFFAPRVLSQQKN